MVVFSFLWKNLGVHPNPKKSWDNSVGRGEKLSVWGSRRKGAGRGEGLYIVGEVDKKSLKGYDISGILKG